MNTGAIIPERVFFCSDYERDSDAVTPFTDGVIQIFLKSQKVKRLHRGVRSSTAIERVLCVVMRGFWMLLNLADDLVFNDLSLSSGADLVNQPLSNLICSSTVTLEPISAEGDNTPWTAHILFSHLGAI